MQAIFIYLLKVCACSGLLLGYYWIALRNKQFHQYNRFYLLCTLILSLVLPVLQLEWFTVQSGNETAIQFMQVLYMPAVNLGAPATARTISWQEVTATLLLLSFAVLLTRLLSRIVTIYRLKKRYPCTRLNESVELIETDLPQAPFSFLSNLFWRTDIDLDEATGRQILQHEITHIREKHTWDKLFLQTVLCLYWMNPFFWLLQRELYLVHEFIADRKAVQDKDASAFAAMLLQAQFGKFQFAPAQPFFYSPIKRRLFMLTTSKDARYSYARRVMVLPLLATVCTLFAFRIQAQQQQNAAIPAAPATNGYAVGRDTLLTTTQVGAAYAVAVAYDTTRNRFGTYKGRQVKDVFVNADHTKVILTLEDRSTKEIPYQEALKNKINLPVSLSLNEQVVTGHPILTVASAESWPAASTGMPTGETSFALKVDSSRQPLYVVDGKVLPVANFGELNPQSIESLEVLKDDAATTTYGEKGRNGVIVIVTKKEFREPVDKRFTITDAVATFPGGIGAWQQFVNTNLRRNTPYTNHALPGTYTAIVSFTVGKDGALSAIKADNNPGYGAAEEAVRLLENSPKWIPALKNGEAISSRVRQTVVFTAPQEIRIR
jgi:TonB-dependent SusC/RagA subfamily outer membrane receptor